jgi:hypothetical protein
MDGEVNVEETGHSLLQIIREGRLSEIFISVTFPSQPAIHNLARDWKVQEAAVEHGHNVFGRSSISTEVLNMPLLMHRLAVQSCVTIRSLEMGMSSL